MKTLDEVIKAWSICFSDNSRSDCTGCPYADEDGDAACFNHDREDALHYLKNYRDSKAWLDLEKKNYAEAVKNCERAEAKYTKMVLDVNRNDPITWDELKQMKGKPVWMEADGGRYKNWFIVGNFFSWFAKEDFDAHVNLYRDGSAMEMSKEVYGSHWQAYRKERE